MGNEMSMENSSQDSSKGPTYHQDQDPFKATGIITEASSSNGSEVLKPMDEDEITMQLKKAGAPVDIYNTGVSDQLLQLLGTLHEEGESPLPAAPELSLLKAALAGKPAGGFASGANSAIGGFSATAQEFVPGRPFNFGSNGGVSSVGDSPITTSASAAKQVTAPSILASVVTTPPIQSSSSAAATHAASLSSSGTLKADAPEFVPSWGKPSATAGSGSSSGTSPTISTTIGATTTSATNQLSSNAAVLPNPGATLLEYGASGGMPSSGLMNPRTTPTNVKVIDKKVWYYRDPNDIVRGPFSTTEMRSWSDRGYFTGGLEVALSDRGPYLPLSAVYPSPERPFWKSVEPREFATRMRQHLITSSFANNLNGDNLAATTAAQ